MRNRFLLFLSCGLLIVFACSDGDVIDFEFDFDDEFEACGSENLLFYKTKEDPSETVSVLIENFTLEDIFEDEPENDSLVIPKANATFTYRTYNRADFPTEGIFCKDIPPADLNIDKDESDDSTTATIIRVFTEDDNDGIPAELESTNGINPIADDDNDGVLNYLDDAPNDANIGDSNGMIEDGFDTDNDGLPNFIDQDDDGDNVLTTTEKPDPDGNGDLSDAQDTDGDGTPDYLDDDDDGDDVLTRDEENDTQDQRPVNDITNSDVGADYLNPNVAITTPTTKYREHTISKSLRVRLIVSEISISFVSQQEFNFGTLTGVSGLSDNRKITPDFP